MACEAWQDGQIVFEECTEEKWFVDKVYFNKLWQSKVLRGFCFLFNFFSKIIWTIFVWNLNVAFSHFTNEKLCLSVPFVLIIPFGCHPQAPSLQIKMCASSLFLSLFIFLHERDKVPNFHSSLWLSFLVRVYWWFCGWHYMEGSGLCFIGWIWFF